MGVGVLKDMAVGARMSGWERLREANESFFAPFASVGAGAKNASLAALCDAVEETEDADVTDAVSSSFRNRHRRR